MKYSPEAFGTVRQLNTDWTYQTLTSLKICSSKIAQSFWLIFDFSESQHQEVTDLYRRVWAGVRCSCSSVHRFLSPARRVPTAAVQSPTGSPCSSLSACSPVATVSAIQSFGTPPEDGAGVSVCWISQRVVNHTTITSLLVKQPQPQERTMSVHTTHCFTFKVC